MIKYNLIFDVSNMFHRSYSIYNKQIINFDLSNTDHHDMLVRKFVIDFVSISKLFPLDNIYFCFDNSSFRYTIDENYKGTRKGRTKSFYTCLENIYKLLIYKKLNAIKIEGLEADDCIALLTEKLSHLPKIIISEDDDLKQLVQPRTMVLTPKKSTRRIFKSCYTLIVNLPEEIKNFPIINFHPHFLLTEKLLKGCDGDNIKPLVPKGFRTKKINEIADEYMKQKMNFSDTEFNSFYHAINNFSDLSISKEQLENQLKLVCLQSQFMPEDLVKQFNSIQFSNQRYIDFEVSSILANTRYWNEDFKK